jgi:hypothetical protein
MDQKTEKAYSAYLKAKQKKDTTFLIFLEANRSEDIPDSQTFLDWEATGIPQFLADWRSQILVQQQQDQQNKIQSGQIERMKTRKSML